MLSFETIKEIRLDLITISLKSDGIVYVYLKENCEINLETQAQMFNAFHRICEGKMRQFLFEGDPGVTVTKEARDNALLIEESSPMKATAVIARNTAHTLLGNFYLKFNKPKRPYKVFKSRAEGLKWLEQFM